ncbi:MAG TPA: MFS transporter [Streptosporangiaceae bacterium]|nr:MFS transporter [Streptosporangiaceae bacterium]
MEHATEPASTLPRVPRAEAGRRVPRQASQRLRRARLAVWCYFTIPGVTMAAWTARIPAVKAQTGVSDAGLSVAILAAGVGALVSMQAVGWLIHRYGSAAVTTAAGVLATLAMIAPGYARSLSELVPLEFLVGAGIGMLDVAMNTHAVEVERAYGRPIMVSFHAMYSIGGLAGALYGSLLAAAGVAPGPTFLALDLPMAVIAAVASRWLLPARPAAAGDTGAASGDGATGTSRAGTGRRWALRILFLGIMGMFCLLDEGAAADWSSVYLRDSLRAAAWLAPLAFAAFSICMALGRLAGDRMVPVIGRVALVRYGAAFAAVGLGTGLLIGTPVAGIAGFGALGLGLSCIIPQLFTTAGNWDPARAGHLVARVSSLSYLGLLVGPVAIGPLADITGLPVALSLPVALAVLVALSAGAVRPPAAQGRATPGGQAETNRSRSGVSSPGRTSPDS